MRSPGKSFIRSALALGVSTLAFVVPALAQGISVYVDGRPVNFKGVPPTKQDGRVLVPLRSVFEAMDAVVDYNQDTRTIDALRGQTRLRLTLGQRVAFVDGRPVTLDVPAQTSLGRTMVPLRFVGEALGAQVTWNGGSQSVIITSPSSWAIPNPIPTPVPQPTPIPEPPTLPQNQTVSGTLVKIDSMPPATITIRADNRNRTFEIARYASILRRPIIGSANGDSQYGTDARIGLADIQTGEMVEITVDDADRATQVVTMPTVYLARVRTAAGQRITLQDNNNTSLNIGQNLRFIGKQGRELSTTNLQPGEEVVLFLNPETRQIYQVSAFTNDLNATKGLDAGAPYLPPVGNNDNNNNNNNNNPPADNNAPRIQQVTFQTSGQNPAVAKAGDRITVTVQGTSGLRGSFDLSDRATNIPLRERQRNGGEYIGNYTVRDGDDVLNGRVTAHLVDNDNREAFQQSLESITIDTQAPRVIGTSPRNGDTINNSQPNITIYIDDLGNSDLAPSKIFITNQGRTEEATTTATDRAVSAIAPRRLSGQVDVRAEISDAAGNTTTERFSFTVGNRGQNDEVTSVYHNANRVLQDGDVLTVDMIADSNGRASFDLIDENNRTIAQNIPMTEIQDGHYRGTYNIQGRRDAGTLRVVGSFRNNNGRTSTANATTTVEVVGSTTADAATILSPTDGQRIGEQITVRGRGQRGSTIEVSIRAEGTQFYIFDYKQEIGSRQVRVGNNGSWETDNINLPQPRNVTGLRYVITATQTDNAGRASQPVSVTVRPNGNN